MICGLGGRLVRLHLAVTLDALIHYLLRRDLHSHEHLLLFLVGQLGVQLASLLELALS